MEKITYLFKTIHELPKLGMNLELRYLGYSCVKTNQDKFGTFHLRTKLNMILFIPWYSCMVVINYFLVIF